MEMWVFFFNCVVFFLLFFVFLGLFSSCVFFLCFFFLQENVFYVFVRELVTSAQKKMSAAGWSGGLEPCIDLQGSDTFLWGITESLIEAEWPSTLIFIFTYSEEYWSCYEQPLCQPLVVWVEQRLQSHVLLEYTAMFKLRFVS